MADLGQVMKRMVHLMETLMSSTPPPSLDCKAHFSAGHHSFLPYMTPPQSCPPQTSSVWTDTPVSLPSSPLTTPHQHGAVCNLDSHTHRPLDLDLGYAAIPMQPHMPSLSFSSPEISHHTDRVHSPIRSRVHSPPPQDGGDEGPPQSSLECSPQTGQAQGHLKPAEGL